MEISSEAAYSAAYKFLQNKNAGPFRCLTCQVIGHTSPTTRYRRREHGFTSYQRSLPASDLGVRRIDEPPIPGIHYERPCKAVTTTRPMVCPPENVVLGPPIAKGKREGRAQECLSYSTDITEVCLRGIRIVCLVARCAKCPPTAALSDRAEYNLARSSSSCHGLLPSNNLHSVLVGEVMSRLNHDSA